MKDYTRIEYGGYTVEIDIPNLFYQIKELIQKEPPSGRLEGGLVAGVWLVSVLSLMARWSTVFVTWTT
jgi:hypothetical protein